MEYEAFVRDKHVSLLRFAGVLCGDSRLADEVVSDALCLAFERWARIGDLEFPYAYVRKIVLNEYLGWRRRSARTALQAELDDHLVLASDHADLTADRDQLIVELRRLPAKQRAAIALRYFEGLTFTEIAELLGSGENAVRSNISRGLRRLRVQYDHVEDDERASAVTGGLFTSDARTQT